MPELSRKNLDEVLNELDIIYHELKKLKLACFRPDKITALALLEYFKVKKISYEENLKLYQGWLILYCEEHDYSRKEALKTIVNEL